MLQFLVGAVGGGGGAVALLDGEAASREHRGFVEDTVRGFEEGQRRGGSGVTSVFPIQVVYLEIVTSDAHASEIFTYEYRHQTWRNDLEGNTKAVFEAEAEALEDFGQRVRRCREDYDPLESGSFIRVEDEKDEFVIRGLSGFLPARLAGWMLNLRVVNCLRHEILFCRHGQTSYNLDNRIGGDPEVTCEGERDARALRSYIRCQGYTTEGLVVWTSRLKRTIQTAEPLERDGFPCLRFRELNEIHAGICEGMTYREVGETYPAIAKWRSAAKYTFRYPGGESYQDLVSRLEPIIMELESAKKSVLVVAHQAVLRALFAYFFNEAAQDSVGMEIPHGTVWRVRGAGGPMPKTERVSLQLFRDE